jgi:hypothetical protein
MALNQFHKIDEYENGDKITYIAKIIKSGKNYFKYLNKNLLIYMR